MTDAGDGSSILRPIPFHYCAGCGHSVLHTLIARVVESAGLKERAVGVCSVGCTFLMYDFLDIDFASAPPGRAPSVATGIKRADPQSAVFTYQGDADALGGLGDIVHAVARGERITMIVVNNVTTGLSGGQMSFASLAGQKTRTTPAGRKPPVDGHPIRLAETLAALGLPARIERVALDGPAGIEKAAVALGEALEHPLDHPEPAILEVLAACPTHWGLTPEAALDHIGRVVRAAYPTGRFGPREGR